MHDTWADKTYTAVDIGECGGSTIIQIEEMGSMFQRMQDAYVTLLARTISYMTDRRKKLIGMPKKAMQQQLVSE